MWAIVITRRLSVSLLTIVQNASLLAHALMDLFKTWTQCSLGNGQYRVLRKLWSKVPYGPYGPFYEILQNASSPTDSVVLCWWFVTMILWWWFFRGVQEFMIQGPIWALWPILWNSAKCFFSYRFCCTVLMVCHNDTLVVVLSGCSGILDLRSHMGPMAHFMKFCKMLLL